LHAHLAAPLAGGAGLDLAVLGPAALARLAGRQRRHFDALLDAGDGVLQVAFHHVADGGAAARRAAGTTATGDVADDGADDVAHGAETGARAGTRAAAHAVLERGVAVRVVSAALRRVGQDLVRFLALLERRFRGMFARIAVRMMLHRA